MTPRITHRRALATVVTLLVILSLVRPGVAGRVSHLPRIWVRTAYEPLTTLTRNYVGGPLTRHGEERITATPQDYQSMVAENQRLQSLNAELLRRLARLQKSSEAAATSHDRRYIDATVTASSGTRTNPTLSISAGTTSGVQVGMAVTSDDASLLVGRVSDVGPYNATVSLITAPGAALQAVIRPPAVASTDASLPVLLRYVAADGTFIVENSKVNEGGREVVEGDVAGIDQDPQFPRESYGLIIGRVSAVEKNPSSPFLFQRIVVRPIYTLTSLQRVKVIAPVAGGRD